MFKFYPPPAHFNLRLWNFWCGRRGASAVDYGLMILVIALLIITAVTLVGSSVSCIMAKVTRPLNGTQVTSAAQTQALGTQAACGSGAQVFAYSGAAQTFSVPQGVHTINVKLWGAGGGKPGGVAATGGAGGFASATLSVTPGTQLTIIVGQGGNSKAAPDMAAGREWIILWWLWCRRRWPLSDSK